MKKLTTKYVCSECGYSSPTWLGKCFSCGKYGTFVEEIIEQSSGSDKSSSIKKVEPKKLGEIEKEEFKRISSGIKELDVVLGGGIVPYSIVLIGGDPGVGKSTILTQVAGHISNTHKVLYVSAEESLSQVKMRADRLNINSNNLYILNECNLESIELASEDYDFIVIDSIQTVYLSELTWHAAVVGSQRVGHN